jgi:fluoride exporter
MMPPALQEQEEPITKPDDNVQTTPAPRHISWKTLALEIGLIGAGGVAGTLARVAISLLAGHALGHNFPWDIICVNITGALLIGILAGWRDPQSRAHELIWLLAATGFLGAYTTFSSFTLGIVTLAADGKTLLGLIYLSASIALGLLAVEGGLRLGAWLRTRRKIENLPYNS